MTRPVDIHDPEAVERAITEMDRRGDVDGILHVAMRLQDEAAAMRVQAQTMAAQADRIRRRLENRREARMHPLGEVSLYLDGRRVASWGDCADLVVGGGDEVRVVAAEPREDDTP